MSEGIFYPVNKGCFHQKIFWFCRYYPEQQSIYRKNLHLKMNLVCRSPPGENRPHDDEKPTPQKRGVLEITSTNYGLVRGNL